MGVGWVVGSLTRSLGALGGLRSRTPSSFTQSRLHKLFNLKGIRWVIVKTELGTSLGVEAPHRPPPRR